MSSSSDEQIKSLARINRIAGQVEGVKKMMEAQRYCPDILTQMRAIRAAMRALEANLLEAHLRRCVLDAFQSKEPEEKIQKIGEMTELYRRFDE